MTTITSTSPDRATVTTCATDGRILQATVPAHLAKTTATKQNRDAGLPAYRPTQNTHCGTETTTMIAAATAASTAAEGAAYVIAWPADVARTAGVSVEYVIDAINTVTGSNIPRHTAYHTNAPKAEVAHLTPAQAKAVIAEVNVISARINQHNATPTTYAPCGVEILDDTDEDGYSQAWEDHLRQCRECAADERDHADSK